MKLFGSSKHAAHSGRRAATTDSAPVKSPVREDEAADELSEKILSAETKPEQKKAGAHLEKKQRKHVLTGVQRGVVLLVLSLAVLCGTVYGVYKAIVKPVEIKQPAAVQASGSEETVKPPTVVRKVTKIDEATGSEVEVDVEEPASHQAGIYNILICGTDDDGTRTDTIIIAHLNTNTHETALMSIPRDTVVTSGSGRIMKINSVYAGGKEEGMKRLETKLGSMLGFELDGYVLVDLDAFKATVDLVGGVNFDVPQDMYYNDPSQNLHINLSKGYQLLDGEKAMELVRFRKGYASQDIQRTKVQQDFLKALAKQCVSIGSLTKIKQFADIFYTYVLTDMTVGNMVYFGQELLQCDFDKMKSYTVEGEGMMINGGSYYPLYASSILKIVNESFNPYDADITAANINVVTPDIAGGYRRSYSSSSGSGTAAATPTTPTTPTDTTGTDTTGTDTTGADTTGDTTGTTGDTTGTTGDTTGTTGDTTGTTGDTTGTAGDTTGTGTTTPEYTGDPSVTPGDTTGTDTTGTTGTTGAPTEENWP
jgi:LCP family protein required for cell wall assembly